MTNSRARSAVGLLVAALAGGGVALAPHAAVAAASPDVVCRGTETAIYQPGLRLAPQTVESEVSGVLSECNSSDASIESGTYHESTSAPLSCDTLFAEARGTREFRWSNGRSSTFAFNRVINDAGGQATVTRTGTIVDGEFVGSTVVQEVVFTTPGPQECLASPGLTSLGPAPVVLTISKD